ncbi:MAG: zinc-ribbon domain-containing protein [Ktedonobacterales bacterium]
MYPQPNAPVVATTSQPRAPHPPHRYSVWFLSLLCVGMLYYEAVVFGLDFFNPDFFFGTGILIYLGVVASILAVDWRHFLTLHGHINWTTLSWPGRIGIALVFALFMLFFLSLPSLYLAFAVKDTIDQRRNSAPAVKLKTAELEASLGYVPAMAGECPTCHKPLQEGAEFCAYCGTALATKPRICGRCATIAPPDAAFCPKCGASFAQP